MFELCLECGNSYCVCNYLKEIQNLKLQLEEQVKKNKNLESYYEKYCILQEHNDGFMLELQENKEKLEQRDKIIDAVLQWQKSLESNMLEDYKTVQDACCAGHPDGWVWEKLQSILLKRGVKNEKQD